MPKLTSSTGSYRSPIPSSSSSSSTSSPSPSLRESTTSSLPVTSLTMSLETSSSSAPISKSETFTVSSSSLPTTLRGKTVLITGGSSGIGLSASLVFHSLSCNVAIFDVRPPSPLPLEFQQSPSSYQFIQGDLRSWESQRSAFDAVRQRFGRIDIVFVNAGITETEDIFFTDAVDESGKLKEPDHKVLDVDIRATGNTIKLAIHHMRQNPNKEGGSIVCTASLAGYLATKGLPMYSAAKHGVVGLMRALKQDVAKHNIAISVIAPAITVTPILHESVTKGRGYAPVDVMRKSGVPLNDPKTVALATALLAGMGMEANGLGLLCQNDKLMELEGGLARTRESWMGKEMLDYFRGGRGGAGIGSKL